MRGLGELEILLAELARSNTRVEPTRIEDVGEKNSLARVLAWQAFARHNTRLGFRNDVLDVINSFDDAERQRMSGPAGNGRLIPILHVGMALGALDRE